MATAPTRLRVLGIAALFVATACSGGLGGRHRRLPHRQRADASAAATPSRPRDRGGRYPVVLDWRRRGHPDERPRPRRRIHGAPPQRDLRIRDRPERHRGRQPRQDPARHRRDDGHLLVQLRLVAPGAEPGRDAGRHLRRAVHRQHHRSVPADGVGRATPSSASRAGRRWAAGSSTTRRSSRPGPRRFPSHGRSSRPTTTSSRQPGSRPSARHSARQHVDVAAPRARRLLQRRGGRPGLRGEVHREPGPLLRHAGGRARASSACRRRSTRAGGRRTSGRPSSTTA